MICIKCRAEISDDSIYCNQCGKKQIASARKALKRANGTGSVYKLQDRRRKPWVARKGTVYVGTYEKKTDALEALERLSGKSLTEKYNMTFAEVREEWKEEHYRTIGLSGVNGYERAFDVFSPLHERIFRTLRTRDFQTIIDALGNKSYSTLAKLKQLITQLYKWAIREEICSVNYGTFIKLPANVKKEKEIFTDSEIAKLKADDSETARIVLMLIYTGMRIGELFQLPLSNYHGEYVIGGEKTEAGRNRIIPIAPVAQPYFAYFAGRAYNEQLISGYEGAHDKVNFRQRDYYALLKRLGIARKTPHATRHTYASLARKAGMRPEVLQKILGHADYQTTANIYVHTETQEMLKAVQTL